MTRLPMPSLAAKAPSASRCLPLPVPIIVSVASTWALILCKSADTQFDALPRGESSEVEQPHRIASAVARRSL